MFDTIIIRTAEVCLKGGNRGLFEKQLLRNLRDRLAGLAELRWQRSQGHIAATAPGGLSAELAARLGERIRQVFGVANYSFAERCPADLAAIGALAAAKLQGASGTFKVRARRSDKSFPLASPEIGARVGAAILEAHPELRVQMDDPDHLVQVDVEPGAALISAGRLSGPGGLPVGTAGRVMALLSGGIDSPVAAWKVMRRGCRVDLVHFHSYPYTGREAIDKARRLAAVLADWQGPTALWLVPIGDLQREIAVKTDQALRIILYRRSMIRLAEQAAKQTGALGLVTGDSIGQVASQTLENLATVSAVASLPIYRPLVGDDKQDISDQAKRIGTFGISIEPHADCCSLFQPDRPATRASAAFAAAEEAKFDLANLLEISWKGAEKIIVDPTWAQPRIDRQTPPRQ
ncbi:MAG: tRNA uracil 4-sulfurtransferase ThiI [Patescibacteria group bacterium]